LPNVKSSESGSSVRACTRARKFVTESIEAFASVARAESTITITIPSVASDAVSLPVRVCLVNDVRVRSAIASVAGRCQRPKEIDYRDIVLQGSDARCG
jgi:hypothetical protein